MRDLLLISSSRVHGYSFLETAVAEIQDILKSKNVTEVLFIPYASRQYDEYLNLVSPVYNKLGYKIKGIHQFESPVEAVQKSQALFVGGGNTFLLLKTLYDNNLVDVIRKRVLDDGIPYIGSSAGTNVATRSINTSNDMPIVYPPSFQALELVSFNINPHYVETDVNSTHKGETRDQRINEFLECPDAGYVLGLKEGSMLRVTGNKAVLKGVTDAKLFKNGMEPKTYPIGADLSFLLDD